MGELTIEEALSYVSDTYEPGQYNTGRCINCPVRWSMPPADAVNDRPKTDDESGLGLFALPVTTIGVGPALTAIAAYM